uniref:Uncharacterized protein n=1 Tax=Anguilla anguilla TaxID=7936 RepID=A0A0E9VMT1_ANGAN
MQLESSPMDSVTPNLSPLFITAYLLGLLQIEILEIHRQSNYFLKLILCSFLVCPNPAHLT